MTKLFLLELPDFLEKNGEEKPAQARLYKLNSDGELPEPVDYVGHRPRFDADKFLEHWRAMKQRKTLAAIARAEQSRRHRRARLERMATA